MAIPVEFFSVVTLKATIDRLYVSGIAQYQADCPNNSFLEDDHLCRVGFMSDIELHVYCLGLIDKGFHFDDSTNSSIDFVVITNPIGLHWDVPWVSFGEDGFAYFVNQ